MPNLLLSDVTITLPADYYNLTLTGSGNIYGTGNALNNVITGNSGNNILTGLDGTDTLDGGDGADTMSGGFGNDVYYVDNAADSVIENAGEGTDTVISRVNYTLQANVENLTLVGTANFGGGNALDNSFIVSDQSAYIAGTSGAVTVTIRPGAGNDTVIGGHTPSVAGQMIIHTDIDYSTNSASQAINANLATGVVLDGFGGTDHLTYVRGVIGGAGNDTLVGGGLMRGASGIIYEVFSGNGGNDWIDGGESLRGYQNEAGYLYAPTGIVVNLSAAAVTVNGVLVASGSALDGYGTIDTLHNINRVSGSSSADTFIGSAADDTFEGRGGNDVIDGGGGEDKVMYSNPPGAVIVNLGSVAVTVGGVMVAGGTAIDGYGGVDTLLNIEDARGSMFNDTMIGGDGANVLEGYGGNDILDGGAGIDWADYTPAPTGITALLANGSATVADGYGGTDTLINIEGLIGSTYNDTLTGGAGDQWFMGHGGSNIIDGGAGSDWVSYRDSPDTAGVVVNLATGTATNGWGGLWQLGGTDSLTSIENAEGSDYADVLTGDSAANQLMGGGGNDTLDGGAGGDAMSGGLGNDVYYVDNAADRVIENINEGIDAVISRVNYTLQANQENLTLAGMATFGGGNVLDNTFIVVDQSPFIAGSSGTYTVTIRPDAGNDTIIGSNTARVAGQMIFQTEVDYSTNSAAQSINANLATGVVLDGFGGTDHLTYVRGVIGGAGNDTLVGGGLTQGLGGIFLENFYGNGGNDWIDGGESLSGYQNTADYSRSPAGIVVNLSAAAVTVTGVLVASGSVLDGYGTIDTLHNIDRVAGSSSADTFIGSAADDTFEGRGGNDVIDGGGGEDKVIYGNPPSAVVVNLGSVAVTVDGVTVAGGTAIDGYGGVDTLLNIEDVRGSAFNDTIIGGDGANVLEGYGGNDSLDGGAGIDYAIYAGAPTGITALLANGSATVADGYGGIDTLINIEGLIGGAYNDTLTGGAGDQWFMGHGGSNIIDGGAGSDWVSYRDSPDTAGVVVNLATGTATNGWGGLWQLGGTDSLTNIENAEGGDYADVLTGDSAANQLMGGGGNDTLDGGAGGDAMSGGLGNDVYYVDNAADRVIENINEGIDAVISRVNYTLQANQENLTLAGMATFGGGNVLDNSFIVSDQSAYIAGTSGALTVTIRPGAGNDTIIGSNTARVAGQMIFHTIVDYSTNNGAQAIDANLATGVVLDGFGGTDRLTYVRGVIGGAGNDTLVGGGLMRGAAGNIYETFSGNGGNDWIDGGESLRGYQNEADYFYSPTGIVVNLSAAAVTVNGVLVASGSVLDGYGTIDTLHNIDRVAGSSGADTFIGSDAGDSFDGGGWNDVIDGAGGEDRVLYLSAPSAVIVNLGSVAVTVGGVTVAGGTAIDGYGGVDTLLNIEDARGSMFNDTIVGGDGANVLEGYGGNDILDGGAGIDYASYDGAPNGITALLANGSATVADGYGGTDTLINIEGLIGSTYNDTLTGGAGDQWFMGHGGSNIIDGGAGSDWVSYRDSPDTAGVVVNLATGTATNGWGGLWQLGGTDSLTNIENAVGGDYADVLTGDSGANQLMGGGGNDTLDGGAGTDTAVFSGRLSQYTTVATSSGWTIAGLDGSDTLSGIEFAQFSDQTILLANNTTPPTFQSAGINGSILTLTYSAALDLYHQANLASFAVSVNGLNRQIVNVAETGSTVTLTLSVPVVNTDTVNVGYKDLSSGNDVFAIEDLSGNDAAGFTNQAVSNTTSSAASSTPVIVGASFSEPASGTSAISLVFNQPMQVSQTSALTLLKNGVTPINIVGTPTVSGSTVTLNTDSLLTANDFVVENGSGYFRTVAGWQLWGSSAIGGSGNTTFSLSSLNLYNSIGLGNSGNDTLTGNWGGQLIGGAGADTFLSGGYGQMFLSDGAEPASDTIYFDDNNYQSQPGSYTTVYGFDTTGTVTNDKLSTLTDIIAANTGPVNGIDVGAIRSHSIASGIVSFYSDDAGSAAVAVNGANLKSAESYLYNNITTAGTAVGFAVDTDGNGSADSLAVFEQTGHHSFDDQVLVMLGGVVGATLGTAPGQNVVQLVDTTPPSICGVGLTSNGFVLYTTEPIAAVDFSGLTLQQGHGAALVPMALTGTSISGNAITLTSANTLHEGDYVLVSFTDPTHISFTDAHGNSSPIHHSSGGNVLATANTVVDFSGRTGNYGITAPDGGNNTLIGGSGDDQIDSKLNGNSLLNGNGGNDDINGGTGNDTIFGGEGNDTLRGEAGADYLDGGAGADKFVFNQQGESPLTVFNDRGTTGLNTGDSFAFAAGADVIAGGFTVGGADGDQIDFWTNTLDSYYANPMSGAPADGKVSDQHYFMVRGRYSANTFTVDTASGSDTLIVYDGDATAGVTQTGLVVSGVAPEQFTPNGGNSIYLTASVSDGAAPTLTASSPADNASAFAVGSNLTLSFYEAVRVGAGNIVLTDTTNPADTRTISITDTSQVTINGSTVTINPTADLLANSHYAVTTTAGSIMDLVGNDFAGIISSTTLDFTTAGTTASALHGISYYWHGNASGHALLSGVTVNAGGGSQPAEGANAPLQLKNVTWDAGGHGTVEVWAHSGAASENVDFSLSLGTATGIAFASALPTGWTLVDNPATGSYSLAAFANSATYALGAGDVKLGTLSFETGSATQAHIGLTSGDLGSVASTAFGLSLAHSVTDANGAFSMTALDAGSYALTVSRATTDIGNAITSADALAALKIAVGINPNADPDGAGPLSAPVLSPYQIMAADVMGTDGKVTSADALAILKMAVKLPAAPAPGWMFVEETRDFYNEANGTFTLDRTHASWDANINTQVQGDTAANLVGILKGDVNGSWTPPVNSVYVEALTPNYFATLAQTLNTPQSQWGIV